MTKSEVIDILQNTMDELCDSCKETEEIACTRCEKCKALEKVVDLIREEEDELEDVVGFLEYTYSEAKGMDDYVRNPKAYALYHTWRKFDEEGK